MKKVLIVSSTPVKGGNSELLCQAFAQGAEGSGHQVEIVNLREKKINFCTGCEVCVKTGKGCVQQDDMKELIEKMHEADVFVLATPIYFMTVSAQLKVFIDRFIAGEVFMRESEGKKAYFISVSAAPADRAPDNHLAANESFRGFLKCLHEFFSRLPVSGSFSAQNLSERGEFSWIEKMPHSQITTQNQKMMLRMKESKYKTYADLPLFLNAKTVAEVLDPNLLSRQRNK